MTYENKAKETTNTNEGSCIDGVIAIDNDFGLTADDLRDIDEELHEMNSMAKKWGIVDD